MDSELRNKLDVSFNLIRQIPFTKLSVIGRSKFTVKDLQVGSTLKFNNRIYLVTDNYNYYENKKDVIDCVEFQLTDVLTGDLRYLEYTEDDTIEIFLTSAKVSTKEIEDSLPFHNYEFIKNEVKDFTLRENRMTFYYDDNWKSRFVKGDDLSKSELVRMVEFEGEDEKTYLTFEFWEDGSMEVFLSYEIKTYNIEILSL